jgi:hypothetical protein
MYESERKLTWRRNLIYLKGRFKGIKRRKRERHGYKQRGKENENGKTEKVLQFYRSSGNKVQDWLVNRGNHVGSELWTTQRNMQFAGLKIFTNHGAAQVEWILGLFRSDGEENKSSLGEIVTDIHDDQTWKPAPDIVRHGIPSLPLIGCLSSHISIHTSLKLRYFLNNKSSLQYRCDSARTNEGRFSDVK